MVPEVLAKVIELELADHVPFADPLVAVALSAMLPRNVSAKLS